MPGGASANPQAPDRGKVIKINKETGAVKFVAHGLRTPNGIGEGVDGEIFVADNQGDWLPASKILHITKDAFLTHVLLTLKAQPICRSSSRWFGCRKTKSVIHQVRLLT